MIPPSSTQRRALCALWFLIFVFLAEGKFRVLTSEEEKAVTKLRGAVGDKLTAAHMKSDAYLIKWIRAKNFNVGEAQRALEKTLAWRKKNGIDNLIFEYEGTEISMKYVFDFSVRDRKGNPVILFPYGDWDTRRMALEGRVIGELSRRVDFAEEKAAQLAFNLTGDPSVFALVDLHGFSFRKHACILCLPIYVIWAIHHELYYPYNFYKLVLVNTPSIFGPVLTLLRTLMTQATRDALVTLGYDQAEWRKEIEDSVDLKNLPTRYGGTKKEIRTKI